MTAITNIDYDHTKVLGKTLGLIAHDKAGIIKSGSVFFTTEQRPGIIKIFQKICAGKKVKMLQLPHRDNYQEYNRSLASAIVKHIGVDDAFVARGMEKTHLQCRFEIMQKNPLVIIDGAHNKSKIRSTITNLRKLRYSKLHMIVAVAENKDHSAILKQIISLADKLYFTRFQTKERKCAHPKELLQKSEKYFKKGVKTKIFLDPIMALEKALDEAAKDDLILVAGSFFLAGEMRKKWFPEEKILQNRNLQYL